MATATVKHTAHPNRWNVGKITLASLIVGALLGMYDLIVPRVTPFQMLFVFGFSAPFTFAIDYSKYLASKRLQL
jgi:hypothetical protein